MVLFVNENMKGYSHVRDLDNMFIYLIMYYSLFCIYLWISYGWKYEMVIDP